MVDVNAVCAMETASVGTLDARSVLIRGDPLSRSFRFEDVYTDDLVPFSIVVFSKRHMTATSYFLWDLWCAGFRHFQGFHARVILDGATCRLGEPGEVDDVLGVLGEDLVVPIVRVLVSW